MSRTDPEEICANCRWWDGPMKDGRNELTGRGLCRVNPPTTDGWPATRAESWCGAHLSVNQLPPADKQGDEQPAKESDSAALGQLGVSGERVDQKPDDGNDRGQVEHHA